MRCGKKSSSRHPRGLSDGGVDAPDVAGRVLFAFRLHTAPIAHSAPHCRLRILKGGRESFECTCVLVFMRTRPLVHVSSIFGPGSGRPKSWYDRGLIRFIILTLSARYSPGILAFLSDSGGNKCPSWRWHCGCHYQKPSEVSAGPWRAAGLWPLLHSGWTALRRKLSLVTAGVGRCCNSGRRHRSCRHCCAHADWWI